jgi:predicted hotdog family 3-hydroxylacyl-ACP dehydratase
MSIDLPLQSLLPHSDPMILIEDPIDAGDGWASSSMRVAEDSLFFKPGEGIPAWVGIEYMAQTVALYAGYCAVRCGREVQVGLLIGIRRFSADIPYFRLGNDIKIRTEEVWQDSQMAMHECMIHDASGSVLANANLNVYQPEDAPAFFEEQKT